MSRQVWYELISNDFVSSGTLFNTYTSTKTVLPPGSLIDFPKNYFTVGKKLKIELTGGLSNIVTTPGTYTPSVRLGGNSVAEPAAIQMTTTANTLANWVCQIWLEVQVGGAAAQFMHSWLIASINTANVGGSGANLAAGTGLMSGPNPPALGTAFDATAALTLDFFNGFSISNAGNGIQIRQYRVFAEN
jgi:hypothetical protein